MSFDKEQYWANRKAGLRGQGETPKPTYKLDENKYKRLTNGMIVKRQTIRSGQLYVDGQLVTISEEVRSV